MKPEPKEIKTAPGEKVIISPDFVAYHRRACCGSVVHSCSEADARTDEQHGRAEFCAGYSAHEEAYVSAHVGSLGHTYGRAHRYTHGHARCGASTRAHASAGARANRWHPGADRIADAAHACPSHDSADRGTR